MNAQYFQSLRQIPTSGILSTPRECKHCPSSSCFSTNFLTSWSLIQRLFVFHPSNLISNLNQVSLLVMNSISFPFQSASLTISQKSNIMDRVKQALSKGSALQKLTVSFAASRIITWWINCLLFQVVTTSQLATKMINADGSPGTFDSGARGIMLPSLGNSLLVHCRPRTRSQLSILGPEYLPSSKSTRVILSPDGLTSGCES